MRVTRLRGRLLDLLVAWVMVGTLTAASAEDESIQYNRDVRPILAEYCFNCHGPDSASRKADLRLDQRDAAIESGAIAPGSADDSELLRRILSDDPDEQMPPPALKKLLTPQQKETLQRWIEQGAPYQPHWSLIAPQRPELPTVRHSTWVRNPIDVFVLARLESVDLEPAPEADRRTLARRASLDLTGLPPDPELVDGLSARPKRPGVRDTHRSAAAVLALGRAPRSLLAGPGPVRGHPRHPLRQLSGDLGVSRLGDRGL